MAKRRIKFIWGGAEQIPGEWKLGVWGVYERDPGSRVKGLAVSGRGLLRLAAATAAGIYLAGVLALFGWFTRNPYNQVTFLDTLFLPLRWSHVREVRGRMMIAEGLDDLKAQRWAEANMKLHAGLSHAPHEGRARLALAQFSVMANQRPEALKILTEDLGSGFPGRKYLETLFSIAGEGEDFDVIIATCDRFMPAAGADETWLTIQKVQALVRVGRGDEVVRMVDAKGDRADDMLKEAKVLALLELHRAPDAVGYLDAWNKLPAAPTAQIARLHVRAYRETGDLAAMDAAWTRFRDMTPADPRSYAYGIVQRALAGQTTEAAAALDDYFRRFSGAAENISLIASAFAEAKAPALAQRCVEEGALHGFPLVPLQFALLQAQMATGDWRGAGQTVAKLAAKPAPRDPVQKFAVEWMTNLVGVVTHSDDASQTALLEFLQRRPLSMRIYRLTCEPLVQARRFAAAQKVLDLADHAYPASKTLADLRAQVDEGLKPPPAAAAPAQPAQTMVREKGFFEELERAKNEGRWKEIAQAIRELRVAKPAWLPARDAELFEWQMSADVHTDDVPELLGAAKFYLDGSNPRASRAVEIAQELEAKGSREDAERLLREVLKKNPDFPPATRLLKQWHQPAPKPGAKKAERQKP